jgi:hypothetical protein
MEKAGEAGTVDVNGGRGRWSKITPCVAVRGGITGPRHRRLTPQALRGLFGPGTLSCAGGVAASGGERRLGPQGTSSVVPLPGGVNGHFGPELLRFAVAQYKGHFHEVRHG